jgi:hypothetical protein
LVKLWPSGTRTNEEFFRFRRADRCSASSVLPGRFPLTSDGWTTYCTWVKVGVARVDAIGVVDR